MARDNATAAAIALVSLVVLAVVASSLPVSVPPGAPDDPDATADEPEPRPEEEEAPRIPGILELVPWRLLFPLVCVFVGLLALGTAYRTLRRPVSHDVSGEGRPDPPEESDESNDTEEPLKAVAEAAGTAADRLEGTDSFENDVYRAWWGMTRALSVPDPQTKTTGEFAEAAIRAGMDKQDVDDLTRLFEDVRYGAREPTDADERRAIEVLRRIEDAYRRDRS